MGRLRCWSSTVQHDRPQIKGEREQSILDASPNCVRHRRFDVRLQPRTFLRSQYAAKAACPILFIGLVLQAQQFDVASIRIHQTEPEAIDRQRMDSVPGSVTFQKVNLRDCIQWAYEVKDYQIEGPTSLASEKYDIRAKAGEPVPMPVLRKMIQNLLESRFHMQFHRETREMPIYELLTAKGGPKLHKAEPGGNTDMRAGNGSFQFRSMSMQQFAEGLAGLSAVARPVLDRTGISGSFDFNIQFGSPLEMKMAMNGSEGSPSIFTLMQEQLGLQLKAGRGPVELFVVDAVDKAPLEN